jgi:hypothetical protein
MTSKILLFVIAVGLALFRIYGYHSMPFPAMGHIYAGWMFGTWWTIGRFFPVKQERFYYLALAVSISLVELFCFIYFRFHQ